MHLCYKIVFKWYLSVFYGLLTAWRWKRPSSGNIYFGICGCVTCGTHLELLRNLSNIDVFNAERMLECMSHGDTIQLINFITFILSARIFWDNSF